MKAFNPYMQSDEIIYTCPYGSDTKSIGREFKVPKERLASVNNLSDGVSVGDELFICLKSVNEYRVAAWDTVQSICEKFGLNKNDFLKFNCIENIFPGQTLYIFSGE